MTRLATHRLPRAAAALLLACSATSCLVTVDEQRRATPQRPRFSVNTQTTAAGTLEVESGLSLDPGDAFAIPIKVKGGLDRASEGYVEWAPLQSVDFAGDTEYGIGDLRFGYRRRFHEETTTAPALALKLEAKVPTADFERGLGTGETDLFVAGSGEKRFDDTRVNGFYQLGLLGEVGDGGLDLQHGFALVGTQHIDSRFDIFGEGSFVWTPELDDEQLFATIGANYLSTPSLIFDLDFRVGLSPDAPDFVFLVGFTQNFGRVLRHRR